MSNEKIKIKKKQIKKGSALPGEPTSIVGLMHAVWYQCVGMGPDRLQLRAFTVVNYSDTLSALMHVFLIS